MTKVTSGVKVASEGLAAIPCLASLSTRERTGLARRCRVRTFVKGAIVFSEGQSATGVCVVLAGRVRLVRFSPRGREQVLHTESAGHAGRSAAVRRRRLRRDGHRGGRRAAALRSRP